MWCVVCGAWRTSFNQQADYVSMRHTAPLTRCLFSRCAPPATVLRLKSQRRCPLPASRRSSARILGVCQPPAPAPSMRLLQPWLAQRAVHRAVAATTTTTAGRRTMCPKYGVCPGLVPRLWHRYCCRRNCCRHTCCCRGTCRCRFVTRVCVLFCRAYNLVMSLHACT